MKKLLWNKSIFLIFIFFIILAVVGIFLFNKTFLSNKRDIILGSVVKGDLVQRVTISGEVVPNRMTFVSAPYSGYIKKIHIKLGSFVKEGSPLVSISQTLDFKDQIFPILAPFDATVVFIQKLEGEYVFADSYNNQNYILRLDDISRLFINAKVPEVDIVKIKTNQEVIVKATAILDKTYNGLIREISLASFKSDWRDSAGANFPIKIEIIDKDEQIKPGMTVTVDVVTNKLENVLILGHEYIYQKDDTSFVYMEDGEKRNIKVGVSNESVRQIIEGLSEGEKVRQYDFLQLLEDYN